MKSTLVTPHAAVLIWSYSDRVNADGGIPVQVHNTEQVIIGTSSIISISTTKRKSSPAGSFEIRLAPRHNWVSRITPGSWCAIMMSRDKLPNMSKDNVGTAQPNSFKMLGRIDSVRGVVEVSQETGARSTVFVVTGQDWGSVFESNLYIDASIAQNILTGNSIAQSYTILGLNMYETLAKENSLPTASDVVDTIINLWGLGASTAVSNGAEITIANSDPQATPLVLSSQTQFQLPKEVARFMRQNKTVAGFPIPGTTSVNFASIIRREHGRLTKFDDPGKTGLHYERVQDSYGVPNPSQFMGKHTLWQLLTDLSNNCLYELVNDIRWDGNQPNFTLYHRIRPFTTRKNFLARIALTEPTALSAASTVDSIDNQFSNVRRINIPLGDVISINYGTNWRDKINFIELRPNAQLIPEAQGLLAKIQGQTVDTAGYQRDGFKPLFVECPFLPFDGGSKLNIEKLAHWKYLLREWYFNNHMMLNGSISIVGQNQYIQVGDNILIDSAVLGRAPINIQQKLSAGRKTFLLAHVENIMHSFSVNPDTGARSFTTTIQFVRGIIADSAGKTISAGFIEAGAIDKFAASLTEKDERNSNTFGSSTDTDPDVQKLNKGNGLL